MNRSKNDHIIEMAKKFIDNCNSFEIKDLDADKQYLNNLPAITPFTDRIKEYLNPFEEEQNQNLTKTSSNKLKVIAFGKNSYSLAKEFFQYNDDETVSKLNIQLVQLPHPSSRLSNIYRKYIVKGIMKDLLSDDKKFLIKKPK